MEQQEDVSNVASLKKSDNPIDAFCEALGLDDRYVMSLQQAKARSPLERVSMRVSIIEVSPC